MGWALLLDGQNFVATFNGKLVVHEISGAQRAIAVNGNTIDGYIAAGKTWGELGLEDNIGPTYTQMVFDDRTPVTAADTIPFADVDTDATSVFVLEPAYYIP